MLLRSLRPRPDAKETSRVLLWRPLGFSWVVLVWFAAHLMAGGVARADTIILESDEWCPYTCNPTTDKPGYMIEIARAVFEARGHTVEYRIIPWARALDDVAKGRADGAVGATATDARDLILPTEPLGRSANLFVTATSSAWTYAGPASLAGLSLGIIKDYSYGAALDAWIQANPAGIEEVGGNAPIEINLRKVAGGRIDATLDDIAVVRYTAKAMGIAGQLREAGQDSPSDITIALTNAKPEGAIYAQLLSDGVKSLRADGRLAQILAHYELKDWK